MDKIEIRPQPGFQEKVLNSVADIAIIGGSSGPGKSWCLLVDPLRHYNRQYFNATIIRKTYVQINGAGGLWDQSEEIYPYLGARPLKSSMEWKFPQSRFVFMHMQNEDDWLNIQGSQRVYLAFDELTQFSRNQFFKCLPWNRSGKCIIPSYIRASCNPDPDSFVADLIDWYIGDDGFPIPERDGVIRYFVTISDEEIWGSSRDEVYEKAKGKLDMIESDDPKNELIKSFAFIKGELGENKVLLKNSPTYKANLMAMSEEEQLRFLHGNWKVKLDKKILFNYSSFLDIYTNDFVNRRGRYITADIATSGTDCMVIAYWHGKRWEDIDIITNNDGKEAIRRIERMKSIYGVMNSHIAFDAAGVGGGLTGWIANCVEFHSQRKPFGGKNMNYKNLKSQCFFEAAKCINQEEPKTKDDMYYVSDKVLNTIYEFKQPAKYKGKTVGFILTDQMKAIREDKPELGGDIKKSIIKKDEQKAILHGISPDFIEQIAFREYFELGNIEPIKIKVS